MARKKEGVADTKLTPKQEAFARAYVETGNASESYRRAYNVQTMAPENIDIEACRLLKHPKVSPRVTQLQAELAARHEVTVDKIVRELALIGFANMMDYIGTTKSGDAFVDLSTLTREKAAAISEVTVEEYAEGRGEEARNVKRTKFKLLDKRSALVDLGKHLGMFREIKDVNIYNRTDSLTDDELERIAAGSGAGAVAPSPRPSKFN